MSDTQPNLAQLDRKAQIRRVVEGALRRRAEGEQLSDEELYAEHPSLLPELAAELRKLQIISRAREEAQRQDSDPTEAAGDVTPVYLPANSQRLSRSLHIRCPLCREPLEIEADRPLDDIPCLSCRGRFSLAGDDPHLKGRQPVTRIAHFELLERLGMGGFGTVWKAHDVKLDRIVALKIPRRGQLSASQVDEFLHEARIVAKLRHPHIVSVLEIGREGDNVFIVSDLVEGVSLEKFKHTRRLTQREATQLLVTVCNALHFAHQARIVHRDLKPSNILVDAQGEPHLTDFGLAKRLQEEVEITAQGEILGTPAYMSPEQARGDGHLVDRRSDVYAVGVMLFELLTDFLPFRGNVVALTQHAIHTEPPSPRRLNATISRDLETICLKCLEKDPARRYASAEELSAELRRYLNGDEILARPISRGERLWRWCRKNPRIPTLSAALLLVTLIAYGVAWVWFENQMVRTDRALTQRALANVRFTTESVAANAGRDFEQFFDLVEDGARDSELIEPMRQIAADADLQPLLARLSDPTLHRLDDEETQSLRHRLLSHERRLATQNWTEKFGRDLSIFATFVLSRDGLQIARFPEDERQTIGRNYAWRAYYNGHPHDESKTWRPADNSDHLSGTYLSPPFVSEFTDEWVVVISTPVFDREAVDSKDGPPRFLGVLGLMVRLGSFAKLPGNAQNGSGSPEISAPENSASFAALVESRAPYQGQVLQHPLLLKLSDRQPDQATASPRRMLLDRSQQDSLRVAASDGMVDADYRDPFGAANPIYAQRWLACRLPVQVRGVDTGLSVIVQESYDQIIGQPLAQMRQGLVLLSLITLGLATAVIVPLWGIILKLVK